MLFSAYYYFYERSRGVLLGSRTSGGGKGLSALESIVAGLIAGGFFRDCVLHGSLRFVIHPRVLGSATTILSNPIWVVQTTQAVRTMEQTVPSENDETPSRVVMKKLGLIATIKHILRKDGVAAFWRGLGPALVLVLNPVIQYTVFEQLKNALVRRRLAKFRKMGPAAQVATTILSDLDYFLLGALSKLSMYLLSHRSWCVY